MSNKELPDCSCGNSYLAIRTDIYKDKREFIYCDCCGAMATRDLWCAALAAQPVAQAPEGMRLVPIEPTPAMLDAGQAEFRSYCLRHMYGHPAVWAAMLAAAPSPEARQHHEQQPDGTVTAVDPAEASNPAQAEAPRWLNVESAMEDPVFQQARAIMGTENWFQDNALRNALNYVLRAAHSPASGVGEREALALDIKSAIAELASGAVYPDLLEAIDKLAAIAAQPQPCGHPASLLLTSAETGEPLYCEACDDKSGRRDAEARESELMAANRALLAELADLKRRGERRAEISSEEWEWLKHPQSAKDLADFVYEFAARNVTAQPLEQKPLYSPIDDDAKPEQVAQDREHAENYRLIRRGQHWSVVDGIGNTLRGDDLDAAVDAIRAARASGQEGAK